ncbi:putative receptor-like protein kinase At3g47110 isoform X2 [Brachypodium distachyon]|nr:putative receptor-like protein kinase At3g47110 isoform X2 [Brachypodium distachyon]|eukprot:XP_003575561.2 putative receptor-like protein kinase At3g47110 isoform X2 [Brachypodium distachyon]
MQERLPFCALRPSKGNGGLMSANQPVRLTMVMLLSLSSLLISYGVGEICCSTVPGYNSTDLLSLLDFKRAIISDPRQALSSWHAGIPHCQWEGVTSSLTHPGRVTVLNLGELSLSGPVSPSVGNLTFLKILNLTMNGFNGELPPLDRLHKLQQLLLRDNSFQGTIPDTITNCSYLETIDLSGNFLIG